ncbi:MAG: 50S ribosomal protein L29 [Parcubacteria group bacterium]|jgi:ribosomal protein L29
MKVVELREKNIDELLIVAEDLRGKIHQSVMDITLNKSKEHNKITCAKRDLAQVMTVIGEKKRSA